MACAQTPNPSCMPHATPVSRCCVLPGVPGHAAGLQDKQSLKGIKRQKQAVVVGGAAAAATVLAAGGAGSKENLQPTQGPTE